MRLFGGEKFRTTMSRLGMAGGEPLYHPLINKSLERAQKKVEERNYDIRKHLLEYDDVVSKQRTAIYTIRNEVLSGEDLSHKVIETGNQILDILLDDYSSERRTDPEAALTRLGERLLQNFNYKGSPDSGFSTDTSPEQAKTILEAYLRSDLEEKISLAGKDQMEMFIRYEYLRQVDQRWQEHLEELTALGEAVRLRSYAQKNPLVEYKNEGFELFEGMLDDLRIDIARKVFKVRIRRRDERAPGESSVIQASHSTMSSLARAGERKEASPDKIQVKRVAPKVGRNDPCPCGSGKKFKNCCGA